MTRERLPNRRASWRVKVSIEGQTFYLTMGEYPDGRLGEIFIDAAKEGTFLRGILDSLARMTSLALQRRVPLVEVVGILRHANFPPSGMVQGAADGVRTCSSIADWIAQELERAYLKPTVEPQPLHKMATADDLWILGVADGNVSPSLERVAGFISQGSGA